MNKPGLVAVLTLLLGLQAANAGDVYREIDAQGNIVYSDRPKNANAAQLKIESKKTDAAAIEKQRQARIKQSEERERNRAKIAEEAERKRNVSAQRAANCEKARAYQQRVETAHRLYDVDGEGNRTYYSAEDHSAALAKARAQVSEWCDTD